MFWQRPRRTDTLENVNFENITLAYEVDLEMVPHDFILTQIDTVVVEYGAFMGATAPSRKLNVSFRFRHMLNAPEGCGLLFVYDRWRQLTGD